MQNPFATLIRLEEDIVDREGGSHPSLTLIEEGDTETDDLPPADIKEDGTHAVVSLSCRSVRFLAKPSAIIASSHARCAR